MNETIRKVKPGNFFSELFERPAGDRPKTEWRCRPAEDYFILNVDGETVAMHGVLAATVTVDGIETRIGGLAYGSTHVDHRRKGYSRRLIEAANEDFEARGFPFSILFCLKPLADRYIDWGCHWLKNENVKVSLEGGTLPPEVNAFVFMIDSKMMPPTEVDLRGLPW